MIRKLLIASATAACLCVMVAPVSAQFGQGNSSNNLFSQYSTQGAGTNTAGIYPAPYDSPRLGAQSYYTYQPLMPHEMMYQHSRNYYNYYNTGGYRGGNESLNKTSVRWQSGVNHIGNLPFSNPVGEWSYKINKRIYSLDSDGAGGRLGHGGGIGHHGGGIGHHGGGRIGHHGGGLLHHGGGRVRGRLHGGGLHGGFGCKSGNCDVQGSAYSEDIYGGQSYGGEVLSAPVTSGCSGGCTANLGGTTVNR